MYEWISYNIMMVVARQWYAVGGGAETDERQVERDAWM